MQELTFEQMKEVIGGVKCTTKDGVTTCTCPEGQQAKSQDDGEVTMVICVSK